ncbi:MAG: pseudouridine-5'-phosphate glycosidase [Saprospiraceae bacterium]
MQKHLLVAPEVRAAIADNRAVVALESTIIAHGMPFPKNVETALRVEQTVRAAGAVPATCAVLDGKINVGLGADDIERIGKAGATIPKASRRDLPFLLSQGLCGATTVASTMIAAHLAGIRIFATGGIGGVHRGATSSMDISADLQELAITPVAVVCAGAKSILDLGLTLEYLETHGVPVLGYQTDELPAFYSRHSGFGVDYRLETPAEIARLLRTKWELDPRGGVVVANPVPSEYELDASGMEQAITAALAEANRQQIRGKAISPFLLAWIERLTNGDSLDSNVELVCNNARLAAEIARCLVY